MRVGKLYLMRAAVAGFILPLLLVFGWATPAQAEGLILSAGPPGEAGLQLDAAVLSPRWPPPWQPVAGWRTYTVKSGDTLTSIARMFGVEPGVLAARNGLADPDRIIVGQQLRIVPLGSSPVNLPANGSLVRIQFWPWPAAQGQTLVVWLHARHPVPYCLEMDGNTYPVWSTGRHGWAVIPISPLADPGPRTLEVVAGESTITLTLVVQAGDFGWQEIPAAVADPILAQADKVRAEAERMANLFGGISQQGWSPHDRFRSPLEGKHPRTSPFGTRRSYGRGGGISAHSGEDFSAAPGTPVLAPASGVVVLAESLFVRGNAVVLDHGRGVFTGYWHLQALHVAEGDRVEAGQLIGEVGNTGLSTGAHLHWEMRVYGVAVDPLQWLQR